MSNNTRPADEVTHKFKNKFVDAFLPPAAVKELFSEHNCKIIPYKNIPTTTSIVTSEDVFNSMMKRSEKVEYEGLLVNRLMIDIAFHAAMHGSLEKAAEEIDIPINVVRKAFTQNPSFISLLQRFTGVVLAELGNNLVDVARDSIGAIKEIINDRCVDPAVRLKAAQDVLDRVGLKQDTKAVIDVNNNINFLSNMTPQEIKEFADIDLREVIDVSATDITEQSSTENENTQTESL